MTSSLVGSEMCIRDSESGLGSAAPAASDDHDDEVIHRKRRAYRDNIQPVSYTHLTLPTICSV
eukprot:10036149-Prorocentrum_lima.AAC.1